MSQDRDGQALHERFVAESIAMDKAWMRGTLSEFLEKKLNDELAEFYGDDGTADTGGT